MSSINPGLAPGANNPDPSTATKQDVIIADLNYRFSGGKAAHSTAVAAAGNTNLITPTAGNRIQLYWISFLPNPDNAASNLVKLGFGTTGGAISNELYRNTAMAHWELFTGAVDQSVIINTATTEPVYLTLHYKEI